MELLVKKVDSGAEYNGAVFDYWMIAQLKSGIQIIIFDYDCYNLKNFIEKKIECLILAYLIRLIETDEEFKQYKRLNLFP